MKIEQPRVRECLKSFDFPTLFREHLGWDTCQSRVDVTVDGNTLQLTAIAQKRGFVAFTCSSIPDRATRLKVDRQVGKSCHEHFIVYADRSTGQQVWQWVRREPGKPVASRDHRFHIAQSGDSLIQRLEQIAVGLDEEERLGLADVTSRARAAFDVDRVTRRFYERFQAEHAAFLKLVQGIDLDADLQWYTSLMLNRLMFVYFIQKKGFLDGDVDYLRNRLRMVQRTRGVDEFQSFYRYFLLRLFHDGLGKSPDARKLAPAMEQLLGSVPFLNGGFFEVHELEQRYPGIDIPDKAFEKLFGFFDEYSWHLDERPLRADNEINPDVVGYIFEKYVNQKQMGAYYTKEDITEYIAKNTVIPFLFNHAEQQCAVAFQPDSAVWRLLRDEPDRYIYASLRKGVVDTRGHPIPLPSAVEAGIQDLTLRRHWSSPATEVYALPNETWRQHVTRRQHYADLRDRLVRGDIHDINDLVTLNLDIWQFARDAIVTAEDPALLRAFWHSLEEVTALDPTCGSGAFLFAALCVLETLYSDCVERMERFVADSPDESHHHKQYSDFEAVLTRIAKHPNERYFVLKSIIINNLFGVDIMDEAVEICKLRLFLKLVAQVDHVCQMEPLPDIDFNIRAGNSLVGYATTDQVRRAFTEEKTRGGHAQGRLLLGDALEKYRRFEDGLIAVDTAFQQFRAQQTIHGGNVTHLDKLELRHRLEALNAELDRYLAAEYGVTVERKGDYDAWRISHRPFHWFIEFYGIMHKGGFSVVIGNPPYIAKRKIQPDYSMRGFETEGCPDVYASVLERAAVLAKNVGRTGMIVPLSLTFSEDFASLRSMLYRVYSANWFSSFGRIPSALFSFDVRVRNTIHLASKGHGDPVCFTTRLHRWFEAERGSLFTSLAYARFEPSAFSGLVPKLGNDRLIAGFERALAVRSARAVSAFSDHHTQYPLYFKQTAYNWLTFCRTLPPAFDQQGNAVPQTKYGTIFFRDQSSRDTAFLALNGKLAFTWWVAMGDDFDLTQKTVGSFPIDVPSLVHECSTSLGHLADKLEHMMEAHLVFKANAGKRIGNYNLAMCRLVTDDIDRALLQHLGLEYVWHDIELIYSQVVRTDFEESGE